MIYLLLLLLLLPTAALAQPAPPTGLIPGMYYLVVTTVNPVSIWAATTVPGTPANNDPQAIEVGVRFRSDRDGYIKGIRFYKGSSNTGPHTGKLYTETGTLLASAIFGNETATGWQEVRFATAVAITANTTYVAAYYTASGNYAVDVNYFTAAVSRPPLAALADGSFGGNNGLFRYGVGGGFPTSTFNKSNYWVDVVFDTNSSTGSGTVTGTGISCGADCYEAFTPGSVVSLTATPAAGSTFSNWTGDCTGSGACIVNMTTARSVTPIFISSGFTLSVAESGTGSGSVSSSPAGITCPSDCSELYSTGTVVGITATPAAGSAFSGWSGSCTGTSTCLLSMTVDQSVTATFTLANFSLLVSSIPDRSSPLTLSGLTITGNQYVFTSPSTGASLVRFFLDDPGMTGVPILTDSLAPFDFAGTAPSGNAFPYDMATITPGTHSITASITLTAGGSTVITSNFTTTTNPVSLAWTDTNSSPNESGTEIWYCLGSACNPATTGTLLATVGANVTTYTHATPPTSALCYAVRAVTPASAFSNTRCVN